ncbi:hypothetical protein [Hyphomicrobium sp. 99]|uniref:hypothetical protein n=1 Tax=Hyphomicrobium sp. 99 TaxID=1163419 RepID=UPI0005F85668|nr:hypothetical protein [Hyphomicrobium sp. 99]
MPPPVQFKKFVKLFLRGSREFAENNTDFIASAVRLMHADEKPIVKDYIRELLGSGISEQELQNIWLSCFPNYGIDEGKMRAFLTEILAQLE